MTVRRFAEWSAEVPSLELLNRMVGDPLPLGLRSGPIDQAFHRDVYFDAPDWTLRRRGVTCRFRIQLDDRRVLTVRSLGRAEGAAMVVVPQAFEAEVPELGGEQAIAGTSDPARRLRALIEPERLVGRLAFETERRIRTTIPRLFRRARFELRYDVCTVRSGPLSRTFQELQVRCLHAARPTLEHVTEALQRDYGLRPLLVGKLERAEKLARELEADTLARTTHGQREIALVVLVEKAIILRSERGTLSVPVLGGSGEDGCRQLLRAVFGSGDGQLRFLGLAPRTLADIYTDIAAIAGAIGAGERGEQVIASMQARIDDIRQRVSGKSRPKVFCEEWGKPIIASQAWVAELVEAAGGSFVGECGRSISPDEVLDLKPEVIVAAWCGTGDRVPLEKIIAARGWEKTFAAARGLVYCIRDEFLNTPAPTLLHGLDALAWAIHPEVFPPAKGIRQIMAVSDRDVASNVSTGED